MEIISNPTHDEMKKAATSLKDGHLVAFPTETVYGLGADTSNESAVSRIYSVKGRPPNHPLIVHLPSLDNLEVWAAKVPDYAIKLASNFWPGPMTLILNRSNYAKDYITGGQESVGLRIPNNSIALELLTNFAKIGGLGVAAPSANRFGAVSPTTAEAVQDGLAKFLSSKDLILDGGPSKVGIESTIIDCTNESPHILRPGAVTFEMIAEQIGLEVEKNQNQIKVRTSGMMASHYSPKARVKTNNRPKNGDGLIALSDIPTPLGAIRLASPKNIEEYAQIFYEALREGDKKSLKNICVIEPAGGGLAFAIRDRIRRSASIVDSNE